MGEERTLGGREYLLRMREAAKKSLKAGKVGLVGRKVKNRHCWQPKTPIDDQQRGAKREERLRVFYFFGLDKRERRLVTESDVLDFK